MLRKILQKICSIFAVCFPAGALVIGALVIGALAITTDAHAAAVNGARRQSHDRVRVADDAARPHPTPWPIRHWRHHQPRRSDLSPQQSGEIDRLYMHMEQKNPKLVAPAFQHK